MKNSVYIFVLLFDFIFPSKILYGQAPNIQWQKTFGGSNAERAYSILIDTNKTYIIAGSAESDDGDVSFHKPSPPTFPTPDFWILRLDSSGNLIWNHCYGGSSDDICASIINSQNGFVMAGSTISWDGDVSGNHNISVDIWVLNIDKSGQIQWQKCLGGPGSDFGSRVIETPDSGYLVVGEADWIGGDIHGGHGSEDFWVVKLNSLGQKQWTKCYGGGFADEPFACKQTKDNGYLISGLTISNDGDVTGFHNSNTDDIWVIKIDSIGNLLWQRCYGGTGGDNSYDLITNDDGTAFILGTTSSNDGDVTGLIGNLDYWLIKIDGIGNILWQKTYGGKYRDVAKAMTKTSDGGIVIVGETTGGDDSMVTGTHGGIDFWICKVDSMGNFQWGKALGGNSDDVANAIVETPDGGLLLAGSTSSINSGDVTSNHGSNDMWVVKLAPLGLSVPELDNTFMELTLFQNNNQIDLRFFSRKNETAQLCLYDVNGKRVFEKNISVNEGINYNSFNCSGLTKGVYFVKIDGQNASLREKVLIE